MSSKRHREADALGRLEPNANSERPTVGRPGDGHARMGLLVVAIVMVSVVVIGADFVIGAISSRGGSSGQMSTPAAGTSPFGVIVAGNGGHWTNVSPDQLAQMLGHKDFTFVNVKTPYIGEIDGTDLYIPYDQMAAGASQLPQAKEAKILVYCRSGAESAQAAQTLLSLGYANVWNLDGGMNAWQSSGRTLVQKNR